ncbi:MAG: contractile injection system tape measure protein, partial [Chitinophagaceae bacterium]
MNESTSHIVSRLRWNTSFDMKERATELQQRLSALSGIKMQREMADVFDKLCPPEQTWRIHSLELNLGEIDLDTLEPDLLEKMRAILHQQLTDLIIYVNSNSHPNIEISNTDASEIAMLRSFLLQGLMPWNYKNGDRSANGLMWLQLQNNREAVIEMIKEVAAAHKDVRKRIAWQFNEPAIHQIIGGLEPANHSHIIGFSNELVQIQTHENIVHTSIADFKKSVWLWILNYLLTERGTLFNKLAFMKSNIRQMADHYNIGYDTLFEMIELAVDRLSKICAVNSDFVLILKALSKEKQARENKIHPAINTLSAPEQHFSLKQVYALIAASPNKQAQLGKLLADYFNCTELLQLRKQNSKQGKVILNHLLPSGAQLMEEIIKQYLPLLKTAGNQVAEKSLTQKLVELYWQCVVNYSAYNGIPEIFKRSFKAAVIFKFPALKRSVNIDRTSTSSYPFKRDTYSLKNGRSVSEAQLFFLLEECFVNKSSILIHDETKFQIEELLSITLEENPAALRQLIANADVEEKSFVLMQAAVSFSYFSECIVHDIHGTVKEGMKAINALHEMVRHIAGGELSPGLLNIFWKRSWKLIKTKHWQKSDCKEFVLDLFARLATASEINSTGIIQQLKKKGFRFSPALRNTLAECLPAFANPLANELIHAPNNQLLQYEHKGLLDDLCHLLIVQKQLPASLGSADDHEAGSLLNAIIIHHPIKFLLVLKHETILEAQMAWLGSTVNFHELTKSISRLHRNRQTILGIIEQFHTTLANIVIAGISGRELQYILFKKLLKAWTSDNWNIIYTGNIWNELIREVCTNHGISKKEFLRDIEKRKYMLPPALQVSLEQLKEQTIEPGFLKDRSTSKPKVRLMKPNDLFSTIPVRNAGLVLMSSYIPMLFERLQIVRDKKFVDEINALHAVHYLQFVATGLCHTEESYLPLNKLLCGLPLSQPVPDGIDISKEQTELIEGMLKAAIGHWPAIGDCSVDGFRGNWLVRDGLLSELEDKWELIVEKRVY